MTLGLINANPVVHAKKERVPRTEESHSHSDDCVDPLEIYDILFPLTRSFFDYLNWKTKRRSLTQIVNFVRDIRDPEHPYSLEQLSVLSEESITVDEKLGRIL